MTKKFGEIFLKCHDASVFQEKNNFEILSKIYYDDRNSSQILNQDQYFIIGEKGTGKTIIAQYLSNIRNDKNCTTIDFSTIDFETFRKLSDDGLLKYIQADQLWQVLLMVLAAEIVVKSESGILSSAKFRAFHNVIQEFYQDRFTPEFPVVVQIMGKFEAVAEIANKHIGKLGQKGEASESITIQEGNSPLNNIRAKFEDAFLSARTSQDHIIFVDKIDIKPEDIKFDRFIKGLRSFARAVLHLNEKVFANMKGRNRIKFVLLLRPDIFDKLNLQNQSARASDNSVILNWDTTYEHHRQSEIFRLTDRFLGRQSGRDFSPGAAWDHYVNADVLHESIRGSGDHVNRSFREFLRLSWFRPRDIIRSLHICQAQASCRDVVTRDGFERSFKQFSDYLYGEVKDFSRFYFSDDTFDLIERFFSEIQRLDIITYEAFEKAHNIFISKISRRSDSESIDPKILDLDQFLQILYSSNIICWRAENDFGSVDDYWAFRERSPAQLEPKVGLYQQYAVHYGLRRALRLNSKIVTGVKDREIY